MIANCRLLVSIDGGVMHIAAAVGTPIVALFGGTRVEKSRPWCNADKAVALEAEVICGACQYTPRYKTCNNFRCMRSISVERVMAIIASMQGDRFPTSHRRGAEWRSWHRLGGALSVGYDLWMELKRKVCSRVGHE